MTRLFGLVVLAGAAVVAKAMLPDLKRYLRIRSMQPTMCLGIPGLVVSVGDGSDIARVDVAGVVREINLGLLDGPWSPGEWVLIHSGFALERMTAEEARDALAVFGDGDLTTPAPELPWATR